ncbi:cbb3-type cytochrome c oxidase subunit I [Cereibacter sediminicola]|uniref:cbb3-type cytochrome c oxidase subunit I n=1 Tax=Cereibacter sediminicola TaxID=2584941 RepID=UPI00119DD5C8|nr:cbb3-type cytochrome c oxidase subunit I [Cereibacter sediminicola]
MTGPLSQRLGGLAPSARSLLLAMAGAAIVALLVGVAGGALTALVRGGLIRLPFDDGYRVLTLHGTSAFFYWLYLVQAAILLAFAAADRGRGLDWSRLGWLGFGLLVSGFVLSAVASTGTPFLYDGNPDLARDAPEELALFNAGYLLLGAALLVLPLPAIRTLTRGKALSATGFALFIWAGFLMVSGFAALYAFLPGFLWSLGLAGFPEGHGTSWHILFHNMHYLPLMGTVIVWYVLMRELTGVTSIFGERFSKVVFAMYLVFVPPTSLYHMFLEPDLPQPIRVLGSLLSLFVSVPTLTAFLIIVTSLEVHARSRGGRGLFGWIRMLPWANPAMAAAGCAVVNMGLGLVFAFVLIQADLAPLLSDSFFVPGYFHFFTVGTVTLSFLAALAVLLPALTGRAAAWPRLAFRLPVAASLGLLAFGAAGIAAGYLGVPRRVLDASYGGEAPAIWGQLMPVVAGGGIVMALSIALYALALAACLLPQRPAAAPVTLAWAGPIRPGVAALAGPLSILAIVIGMYGFTALGFELMRALPIEATGGTGGH